MTAAPLRLAADESPTQRMLATILEHVAQGFAEADCPLTDEQQAFIDGAIAQAAA